MAPCNLIYVNNYHILKNSHPKTLICKQKQVENKLKMMEIKYDCIAYGALSTMKQHGFHSKV
jgi:hypothetical protein